MYGLAKDLAAPGISPQFSTVKIVKTEFIALKGSLKYSGKYEENRVNPNSEKKISIINNNANTAWDALIALNKPCSI